MSLSYISVFIIIVINQTVSEMLTEMANETRTESATESVTEMVHKTSNDDENDQLQILHSTPEAEFFLEGCTGEYNSLNRSFHNDTKEKMDERTFTIENEDSPIMLGLFSLYQISILLYFEIPTGSTELLSYVNITLGIERNSKASISGHGNFTQFEKDSQIIIDESTTDQLILPGMPFYIGIDTASAPGRVQVSELRQETEDNRNKPFLQYQYTNTTLKPKLFRIEHDGPIYAHYRCCKSNCSRQTFHRISGCQKYSTRSVSTQRMFDVNYYNNDVKDTDSPFTFNGNFFIYRPNKTPLAAKIRLRDSERTGDFYDAVLTDTYAIIYQHDSEKNVTYNKTVEFPREQHNPVTINITVTKNGRVSLTRTYETKPFMIYHTNKTDRESVTVTSMSMSKVYGDANRYDFYYNCSDVLTYFNETTRPEAITIIEKFVNRFNDTRYDLVQIFNDSFNMDEKYGKYYNEEFSQFDDADFKQKIPKHEEPSDDYEVMKKVLTGTCSFLFVGFLKYVSSFQCVKDMTKDVDEEKREQYKKTISTTFDAELNSYFGIQDLDD